MKRLVFAVAALGAFCALADVKVKSIFSNDMVLQRGKPIPVSGTAAPGEAVTVTYDGKSARAVAGADGRFKAVLPPLAVEKTGKELVVAGKNRVVFKNVSSSEVAAPVAVRYAFRANPMGDCNLYNKEGLPASPFRTDKW